MSYNVKSIAVFEKQAKRLIKKFFSLKKTFKTGTGTQRKPELGTAIEKNCFKIRIAIASKGKGKSGGARVITYFVVTEITIFLISIYDKSERENITNKELDELLMYIPE